MHAVIFDLDDTVFATEHALYDGVADLLAILRRLGIKVGAVSSGDHRMLVRLDEAGIRNYFTSVLCSEHMAEPKDPAGLRRLMDILGVDESHTALVSRSHQDIVLGKHAGLAKTIHISTNTTASAAASAHHVIEDVPAVLDVLEAC